jgi:hypothetical protein
MKQLDLYGDAQMKERLNTASSSARHQWLERAVALLRPRFVKAGYRVPNNIRVSIGFTRYTNWQHSIGQCWSARASSDQHTEIFISPELGTEDQTSRIIGVTAHELVHATVGPEAGHRGPFKQCANSIGLTGRMTSTTESDAFIAWVNDIVVPKIGPYPAGKILLNYKKQTTRLVKCECLTCHYPVRTTRMLLESKGPPHCPQHGEMVAYVEVEDV